MNTSIATQVRPLAVLVPLIKKEIKLAQEAAEKAWFAVSELLWEAKQHFDVATEFYSWTDRNFQLKKAQASRYLEAFVASGTKSLIRDAPSLNAALKEAGSSSYRPSGTPIRPWHEPVKDVLDRVNVEAAAQGLLARAKERELQRKLALQLIDIGYKALATKFHPDKGGSKEAMARLNSVRNRLKDHA